MPKLSALSEFVWNSKEKRFFGRKKRGWVEICAFFVVFYAVLFSFFCGMLSFFFQTVSERVPYLTGDKGFLSTPGLGIRPLLKMDSDQAYMTLIYFTNSSKGKHTRLCIKSIREELKPYLEAQEENFREYWKECGPEVADKYKSCIIRYRSLTPEGQCNENNGFGYPEGKPCVLLRLNKAYGWKPDPYRTVDNSMPTELQKAVKAHYQSNANAVHRVWVLCEGDDDFDKDNLGNDTVYYPQQGFMPYHFPYLNQYRHLSPLIMVKFNSLKPNIAVKVQCKVYARNIKFDLETWRGGFHFELFYLQA